MATAALVIAFIAIGSAVIFVAYSGGPGRAREAYLTGGRRAFRVIIPILYIAAGIAVPALVIADREEAKGGTGRLATSELTEREKTGKALFRQNCATCHALAAVNARGVTGPSLDEIGQVNKERVVQAIDNGGTGQGRMPADILQGEDAEAVAEFVAKVAAK